MVYWGSSLNGAEETCWVGPEEACWVSFGGFTLWHRGHMWIALLFQFLLGDESHYFAVHRKGSVFGFSFVFETLVKVWGVLDRALDLVLSTC